MITKIVDPLVEQQLSQEFARDVDEGLSAEPKRLKPKYFYDNCGSELFEEICRQPEYYLTRTERQILERHSEEFVAALGDSTSAILELGSGSSSKIRILLQNLLHRPLSYFPIDISHSYLQDTVKALSTEFAGLDVIGLPTDYLDGVEKASRFIASRAISGQKTILFLGSSIGNFEIKEAELLLKTLVSKMDAGDSLIIGFDLHKDPQVLNAAYNDLSGANARFNLNVLARINKELGGEFDPDLFEHRAFYNRSKRRIEMHLVSKRKHKVHVRFLQKSFHFEEGESIHTENSYKYTPRRIDSLARKCNLSVRGHFTDSSQWFDLVLFERKA